MVHGARDRTGVVAIDGIRVLRTIDEPNFDRLEGAFEAHLVPTMFAEVIAAGVRHPVHEDHDYDRRVTLELDA